MSKKSSLRTQSVCHTTDDVPELKLESDFGPGVGVPQKEGLCIHVNHIEKMLNLCHLITVCTVRAMSLVNGTPRFLDPRGSKTPDPIDIKFDSGDYVGDITPHANFGISVSKGGSCTYA